MLSLNQSFCTLALLLAALGCGCQSATNSSSTITPAQGAQFSRGFILAQAQVNPATPLADWQAFSTAINTPDPEARERALHAVYKQTDSPYLRAVALRAQSEDPAFQSNQAQFIRKYGFYANWFNRVFYSLGRILQGNVQASVQVLIDAVHDTFRPPEANEYERRAYALLQRERARGGHTSPRMLAKLQDKVDRALAKGDLENGEYALSQGDADAAVFYGHQAQVRRPDWSSAKNFTDRAESAAAGQRRDALKSSQVGFPDRTPPVEAPPAAQLRELLLASTPQPAKPDPANLIPALLAALPASGDGDALQYSTWARTVKASGKAPDWERRWAAAMLLNPDENRQLRLERARQRRRGQLTHFIFIGPEENRERAYKTATWLNQALDALQNVGIFYIFEVFGRTGQVIFAPPVPADAVLDAQADWLRHAPAAKKTTAQAIARDMAKTYQSQRRFQNARLVLAQTAQLDAARKGKLDTAEAKYLLVLANDAGPGADRERLLARARTLNPGEAERRAAKFRKPRGAQTELAFTIDWPLLQHWTNTPPPCGLPGDTAWFDHKTANGEILTTPVIFSSEKTTATVAVLYNIVDASGNRSVIYPVAWQNLPQRIRQGLATAYAQRAGAQSQITALDRLPVPFEIEGGLGAGGVDVYPKLLPMQSRPGELELYKP